MDSNPPVPALLAVFEKHDAIEGCFDEEAQGMLERAPEPNLIVPLQSDDPESVRAAFQTLAVAFSVFQRSGASHQRHDGTREVGEEDSRWRST